MRAPRRKRILPAIKPNVGTGETYRKELQKLIDEMNESLIYWLSARFREVPPTAIATDESWFSRLRRTMDELVNRWERRFEDAAPRLAQHFAKRAADRPTGELARILADAGMTVDFRVTPAVRTAMAAIVEENVGLIRSLASEHLADVRGIAMRSAAQGRDLATMTKELRERFDVPKQRAALISRDQNNKTTAAITRLRQQEVGIDQAIWMHSGGGKHPRPEHVAFSQGRLGGPVYDVAKGALLEGQWVWPGTAINCRCVSRPVLPGF